MTPRLGRFCEASRVARLDASATPPPPLAPPLRLVALLPISVPPLPLPPLGTSALRLPPARFGFAVVARGGRPRGRGPTGPISALARATSSVAMCKRNSNQFRSRESPKDLCREDSAAHGSKRLAIGKSNVQRNVKRAKKMDEGQRFDIQTSFLRHHVRRSAATVLTSSHPNLHGDADAAYVESNNFLSDFCLVRVVSQVGFN